MVFWFAQDRDTDHIACIADHPDDYVVNTHLLPDPLYLVLHRASCWTLSRTLPAGQSWMRRYGKACSNEAADLHRWAEREVRGPLRSCGLCGGDGISLGRRPLPTNMM